VSETQEFVQALQADRQVMRESLTSLRDEVQHLQRIINGLSVQVRDLEAERDAFAARVAVLEAALAPAWEASRAASSGLWANDGANPNEVWGLDDRYICGGGTPEDADMIVRSVNAVRAAHEAQL
jgi:uncharacterized protein YhaN